MPWTDWQFWAVTLIAVGALLLLKRALLPKKRGKKTTLTVGGRPVAKTHKPHEKDCGCS